MAHFQFKEEDQEGLHTLEAISEAEHFNTWMYREVSPFLTGRILEVGSGIGNLSGCFIRDGKDITMSEIRSTYCSRLQAQWPDRSVLQMDLVDARFNETFAGLTGSFDSAFALNVIEHIGDHALAMKNLVSLVKPGGKVLILVPAHQFLYNKLDTGLAHFRRYDKSSLAGLMMGAGLKVERSWMFNALGIPAWITGGLLFRENEIGHGQMKTYDRLVPLARLLDRVTFNRIGLSVIGVGVKSIG